MKRLVIAVVLAVPAVAGADKNFLGGGGSWDCSKDATVNISGKGKYVLTGTCKTINLSAGDATITAASVGEININGAKNTIDCDELGKISIVGANNKVTYKKGKKPAIAQVGSGNSITRLE